MNPGNSASQAQRPSLVESYRRVLFQPRVESYEAEVPNTSWARTWTSVAIAAIASLVITLIIDYAIRGQADIASTLIGAIIGVPVGFFIGSLILYGLAALFGGRGRTGTFSTDFMIHSYLLSLLFTPLSIAQDIISPIPAIGILVLLALGVYQLYSLRQLIQVSRLLTPSSATGFVITLLLVGVVLGFLLVILVLITLGSMVNNVFSEIGSGLGP